MSILFEDQMSQGQNKRRNDNYENIRTKVHQQLLADPEVARLSVASGFNPKDLAPRIEDLVTEMLTAGDLFVPRSDRQRLVEDILAEAIGYGPIQSLLNDDTVSEIMINGPQQVYIEKSGKIFPADVFFRDDRHVMHVIERIVTPLGRRIDEMSPMVDARLPDGSRVNAIIPPLALNGPVLTIRKFFRDPLTVEKLIASNSLTRGIAEFFELCVRARLNIIVSGGTGSGKTTMLNVLSSFIPSNERIVTIEDAAELKLRQEHVVTLETRPPNIEGRGEVTIRDLVRNSLRMRPDRVIVGEVRGAETLDMLQAMNTGHDGSLTTGHANTPRDMFSRLETMVLMAGMDLPVRAIREQISSAIDLVVHVSRFSDGSRKISHVVEVQGMEGEVIVLQEVFVFRPEGVDENGKLLGSFICPGLRPKFLDRIEGLGLRLPPGLFGDDPRMPAGETLRKGWSG